ncbi:MAG: helicase HerA domain-containing protein [Egibacteraceae bacterium]
MKPVVIGKAGKRTVALDLEVLLRTRLLVQANSGGGKSYLLRRLAEQMFGKIPVHIIDPEGEFSTLREKYAYVLVGKGGETPAHPGSAALVAHRLLECRASAVLDVYDLKPATRHHWIKLYLEALVDAPKTLWRPTVIIIDEAHVYAPEKGQGESEAYGAVIDLVTRGRKRGFCPILATQRLGKLSKNVSAEMLNRLVGMTFEDVDLVRAADLLSVPRSDRDAFFKDMKVTEPGQFWALGRAIAKDRILVHVGRVETTHPEPGKGGYSDVPPPAPEQVRALLPRLQDLPKEAEEKAKSEGALRAEIRSLKAQLAAQPKPRVEAPKPLVREVAVIPPKDLVRLERAMETADRAAGKIQDSLGALRGFADQIRGSVRTIEQKARTAAATPPPARPPSPRPVAPAPRAPVPHAAAPAGENGEALDKPQRAVLVVLGQYADGCLIGKLALLTGYRVSGGFRNALGALRTKGYMTGLNTGTMQITERGIEALGSDYAPLPEGADLTNYWRNHPSFGTCERKVFGTLLENPDGMTMDQLAEATGYGISGGFRNALGALRTAGVLVGKNTETMRVCSELLGVEA